MERNEEFLNEIERIDVSSLKRTGKDYDFEDIFEIMKRTKDSIKAMMMEEHYITILPSRTKESIYARIESLLTSLKRIQQFDAKSSEPQKRRDDLARQFADSYHDYYRDIETPFKVYEIEKNISYSNTKQGIDEISSIKENLKTTQKEAEGILIELKDKALESTVSNYAMVYQDQAIENIKSSKRWLTGGYGSLITLIGTMLILHNSYNTSSNEIGYIVFKVTILVTLFFIVTFTFRQYSINKHLYTLNKHRENTLNSYKLFIEGISDENIDVRNAIMMQVARSIYEHGKTGYINDKSQDTESPSVIELIRTLPKSS